VACQPYKPPLSPLYWVRMMDGLHLHSQMHSGRVGHLAVLPLVLPVCGIPMLPPLQLKLDKQQLQQQ
jgi:hypothetical protein